MTLSAATLKSGLHTLFANPPHTEADCRAAWASALESYAASVTPPSTTATVAASTFQAALVGMSASGSGVAIFESALSAFAAALATGMSPAFTGVPPSGSVGFTSLAGSHPSTHDAAATSFANLIHAWFLTGMALPPIGAPIPWS